MKKMPPTLSPANYKDNNKPSFHKNSARDCWKSQPASWKGKNNGGKSQRAPAPISDVISYLLKTFYPEERMSQHNNQPTSYPTQMLRNPNWHFSMKIDYSLVNLWSQGRDSSPIPSPIYHSIVEGCQIYVIRWWGVISSGIHLACTNSDCS